MPFRNNQINSSPAQVKELFEVEGELRPCSNEVMLAGMLGVLRDSHWCAAHAVVAVLEGQQEGCALRLLAGCVMRASPAPYD